MARTSRAQAILALMAILPDEPLSLDDVTGGLERSGFDFGPTGDTPERRRRLVLAALQRMTRDGRLTSGTVADFDVWYPPGSPGATPPSTTAPRTAPGPVKSGRTGTTTPPAATRPAPRTGPAPGRRRSPRDATRFGVAMTTMTLAGFAALGAVGYSLTPDEHAPRATPTGAPDTTTPSAPRPTVTTEATTTPPGRDEEAPRRYEEDYGEEDFGEEDFTTDTVITVPATDDTPECVVVYGHTPDGQEWVETDCPTAL